MPHPLRLRSHATRDGLHFGQRRVLGRWATPGAVTLAVLAFAGARGDDNLAHLMAERRAQAQTQQLAPPEDSLAHFVPADVGLYIELRGADDLLVPLTEPQTWVTLAELAGQPARPDETEEWRQRVQQTINMSPTEAVQRLLAQRFAFVGEGLRRAQDAVVLCRPREEPQTFVRSWMARPLPTAGRTSVYRLPNNVGVAVHGDLLVFGDNYEPGMFARVLRLLETGSGTTLAADPVYRRLLARVPTNPDGIVFFRVSTAAEASGPASTTDTAPASAPAASAPTTGPARRLELPGPLRDSSHVLLALHREGSLLHFSAVGDAPHKANAPETSDAVALLHALPARTLVAWAGNVDHALVLQAIAALPERNVLRVMYDLQQRTGTVYRLTAGLEPAVGVAVGVVTPAHRPLLAPPVPALAILLVAREPEVVAREWDTLVRATLSMYKLLSLRSGAPPREPPEMYETLAEGVRTGCVVLSGLFPLNPELTPVGEIELCWAQDGRVLIVATHSDWLRQILAARHGQAPQLKEALAATHPHSSAACESLFVAQTGPIADLGQLWIDYLAQTIPCVLNEDWWRAYQPGGREVRLGIQVIQDPQRRSLRVISVTPGAPAWGYLKPGDDIVGCNRRRFATSQPVLEMQRGLAERPDARWVDLLVERDGGLPRVRRVALPFVDPVRALRRLIAIGRLVQRVAYSEDVPEEAGPRGQLTLQLRGAEGPLFAFEVAPPAGLAPATSASRAATTQALPRPDSSPPPGSQPTAPPPPALLESAPAGTSEPASAPAPATEAPPPPPAESGGAPAAPQPAPASMPATSPTPR